MRMLVFQVTVWPDKRLGGKHNFVFGLLKLLQQLFRTRRKDHVITVESPTINNCYCHWSTLIAEALQINKHTPGIIMMDVNTYPQRGWLCSPPLCPPEQTSAGALSALHLEETCNLHLSMFHPFQEPKTQQRNVRHQSADYRPWTMLCRVHTKMSRSYFTLKSSEKHKKFNF